jgi:hypothetical protein
MLSAFAVLIGYSPGFGLLVLLIIGVLSLYFLFTKTIPLAIIMNTRLTKVSEAKGGVVRLEGTAKALVPMKSPIVGAETIYFRSRIFHVDQVFLSKQLTRRFYEQKCSGFVLEDESGRIEVEAVRPMIVVCANESHYEVERDKEPPEGISRDARKMLKDGRFPGGNVADSGGYFSVHEEYIPTGNTVTAVVEIKNGKVKPLILTDDKYFKVEGRITSGLVMLIVATVVSFALLIAFTLMLYYG